MSLKMVKLLKDELYPFVFELDYRKVVPLLTRAKVLRDLTFLRLYNINFDLDIFGVVLGNSNPHYNLTCHIEAFQETSHSDKAYHMEALVATPHNQKTYHMKALNVLPHSNKTYRIKVFHNISHPTSVPHHNPYKHPRKRSWT